MNKTVNRGYKVRIYPNENQIELFEKTFGCVRLIWNYSLMEKEYMYELFKDYSELLHFHSFKTPADWKREFPFLKEVDSQALATTQQELIQSFKNFYNKSHNKPKYKSKKNQRVSYTSHTTNNNIRIEGDSIKLPKIGYVKLKRQRKKLPSNYTIKAATIKRTPTHKYYVSLRLEFELQIPESKKQVINPIGLDFSLTNFYIDSNGEKANYPYYYKKAKETLSKLQRKLSNKVKDSNQYHYLKQRIAKLHEKIVNQRNDFLHKLSRYLVDQYDIISTETLCLKSMMKNKHFSKKINDISYHRFLTFLQYKCEETGTHFHQVPKYYASSKICSNCGVQKKTLPLSQRVYSCDCGCVIDRDVNAAINLATKGMISYLTTNLEDRTASLAW